MNRPVVCFGIYRLSRSLLAGEARRGRQLDLTVLGLLKVADDVTPELVEKAVGTVSLHGTVRGPAVAVQALRAKMR